MRIESESNSNYNNNYHNSDSLCYNKLIATTQTNQILIIAHSSHRIQCLKAIKIIV